MTTNELDHGSRIIDANLNRASEGLRVCEDYCRFAIEDQLNSGQLKELRHQLFESVASCVARESLRCRDTINDAGAENQTDSEYRREDLHQVFRSNMARVQQSLRCIEEYSKLIGESVGAQVEALRYRSYVIEKSVCNVAAARQTLADARIYVLVDLRDGMEKFVALVHALVAAHVDLIQLRDKSATDRELVEAGKRLTAITRPTQTRWIMNDRADLALACNADGVHVGQDDIAASAARNIVGPEKLVGLSTHNWQQVQSAMEQCPDYIGVGPVFPSRTKDFDDFADRDFLARVANEVALPSFAIGGIDERNIEQLIELGINRVAVGSSVARSDDPAVAVRQLLEKLMSTSVAEY